MSSHVDEPGHSDRSSALSFMHVSAAVICPPLKVGYCRSVRTSVGEVTEIEDHWELGKDLRMYVSTQNTFQCPAARPLEIEEIGKIQS
jgi:hypothetical protein